MAVHFERALSTVSELCLVLWILHCPVKTDVLVKAYNNKTIQRHQDQPASFGRLFPRDGLWGHLSYVEPEDGCFSVHRPLNGSDWIAVMSMSEKCEFEVQVMNAQIGGFIAAIVHNNKNNDLIVMKAATQYIRIPSTFIGLSSSNLLSQFDRRLDVSIVIIEYDSNTEEILLITLAAVFSFAAIIVLGFVIGIGIRNCCKNRSQMLSWWKLKRLPVHVFKKGDLYDNCAICLEEYNEGDKLRVLPCAHAFHSKCIDVWLTKNRKTCPLCNETVNPSRRKTHHADSEQEQNDERRPLLMPVSNDHNSESEGNGELVRSRSDIEIHEEPSRHLTNGHRNYGATGVSGIGPERDHLVMVENVNVSERSPLRQIERDPGLSVDVLASKAPALPFEDSVQGNHCQGLVETESVTRLQEPEVCLVPRNSAPYGCNDIV